MQFVSIPAGTFMMGCSAGDPDCYAEEKPVHRVTITRPFEMGKFQVTQAEYEAVMSVNPSNFKGANLPVENVSWEDANRFCEALNSKNDGYRYRLPTEAEWEYAARAGDTSCRYGPLLHVAWFRDNSEGTTHPVGGKQPNSFGLYDMLGERVGMGTRLVRDNLLQQQTGNRPARPSERRVPRFARRLVARSRQRAVARLCSLHLEAQRSEHGGWVSLCA
jgi:Sulfatase-modifying factor enzyme 1